MSSRVLAACAKAADWTPAPLPKNVLQRRAAHAAGADFIVAGGPGRDFSRVPARVEVLSKFSDDVISGGGANDAEKEVAGSEAAAPQTSGADTPETLQQSTGAPTAPQQTTGKPVNGKVTSLDVITGPTGAVTGFPAVPGGGSLDSPGAFNDTTTGACRNIHQMKFTVIGIPTSELLLLRTIDRTATVAGMQKKFAGVDGPNPTTVLRPANTSYVAVADSPGYKASSNSSDFPISYNADFKLYAFDFVTKTILAELNYTVTIAKSTLTDAKPTNSINVTKKVLK
jgi:hypothetical protein